MDAIDRQAAIDAVEIKIKKWNAVDGEGYHVGLGLRYTDVIDTLTELPSVQPDWTDLMVICDNCGHAIHVKRTDAKPTIEPERISPCADCQEFDCYGCDARGNRNEI